MGHLQEATALLRRTQEQYPGDFWLNHTLAHYLVSRGTPLWNEAIPFYTAAVALRPDSAGARLNLGVALVARGRLEEGLAAFRRASDLKPDYAEAYNNVGITLHKKGRLDEALAAYRKASELKPDLPEAPFNLGLTLASQGRLDEALAAYRKAIELKPTYAEAHGNLGLALQRKGRLVEAVAAFRKAIELKPDWPEAHFNLGLTLASQGRLDEAVAAFRKAIELKPDLPQAPFNLGLTLTGQGRLDEAVAAYRRASELKPDFAEAYCNLGYVLRQRGEFVQALAALKRGHELGSRDPDWPYPSARWVEQYQRLGELAGRLPAVLRGEAEPTNTAERNAYALLCYDQRRYAAAARLRASALTADPKLADDVKADYRYDAACAAALAAGGRGADADQVDDKERARWREQARQWLRADLAAYGKLMESGKTTDRQLVLHRLRGWLAEQDLAGLRDPDAVARLPAGERQACTQLWAEVQALLTRAEAARSADPRER
jgi:Flp pilus assembly protein TadD